MKRSPLNDAFQTPNDEIIESYLHQIFPVYQEFVANIDDLPKTWTYYNDVKYWLLKVTNKKKTLFWLTVWEGYFKIEIYFNEKTGEKINDLPIDNELKAQYEQIKSSGKTKPITVDIKYQTQLNDVYALIQYKKEVG